MFGVALQNVLVIIVNVVFIAVALYVKPEERLQDFESRMASYIGIYWIAIILTNFTIPEVY